MAGTIKYHDYLIGTLKNKEEAAGYLSAALEGGDIRAFLLALHHVVEAQGGITKLAEKSHKSRTSLYKALSKNGNPYLKSTNEILSAIGLHLAIVPCENQPDAAEQKEPL